MNRDDLHPLTRAIAGFSEITGVWKHNTPLPGVATVIEYHPGGVAIIHQVQGSR